MPRKRVVSKHTYFTETVCRCVNTKTGQIVGKIVRLPGIATVDRKTMDVCRKFLAKRSLHVMEIESVKYFHTFAEMSEIEYLNLAQLSDTVECNNDKSIKTRKD